MSNYQYYQNSINNFTISNVNVEHVCNNQRGAVLITGIKGRTLPKRTLDTVSIVGRPGTTIRNVTLEAREIEIEYAMLAESPQYARELYDLLVKILCHDTVKPIIFADEPTKVYYGIVTDITENMEMDAKIYQGSFKIICPDPYKYSTDNEYINLVGMKGTVFNRGNAPCRPIIEFNFTNRAIVSFGFVNPFCSITIEDGVQHSVKIDCLEQNVYVDGKLKNSCLLGEFPILNTTSVPWIFVGNVNNARVKLNERWY